MVPTDIGSVIVNGQVVYYKRGEVIAIGEAAREFVAPLEGAREESEIRREVFARYSESEDEPVSKRPTSYHFSGLSDALAVVDESRARGLRVQPNHVLVSHCGCQCDPCCGGHLADRTRANPFWANSFSANPFWANPFWANALVRTTAIRAEPQALRPERTVNDVPDRNTNVTIWILDTGIPKDGVTSPINGRGVGGQEVDEPDRIAPSDGLVDPVAGHGTFIAGIIEELAPGCNIDVSGIIEPSGFLEERDVEEEIYRLLDEAGGDRRRTILSLSFGGGLYDPHDPAVGDAIAAAQEAGVVVVASAGNGMSCRPVYPANFPGVVAVGAVDQNGQPAAFTNVGTWVQACALGVDVTSTFFEFPENPTTSALPAEDPPRTFDGWAIWSGTSFAAPVVVGAIAARLLDNDELLATEALATVLDSGTPIDCLGVWVNPEHAAELAPEARPPT